MNDTIMASHGPTEVARTQVAASPPPSTAALGSHGLRAALDALDTGVMVSDARGHLLLANEAARSELADGRVLRLTADGALDVSAGVGLLALRRAVHGAALDHSHQLVPLRHAERALMVAVQPLRTPDVPQPCALLLLGRRGLAPELAVQQLGRLYELTSAEQGVLISLLSGTRIRAMAQARGVAVSTVRTQVAALRAKFGVRRVDDITRLVAELPPMLGALRQPVAAVAGGPGSWVSHR